MKKKIVFMLTRPVYWNIYSNLYKKFDEDPNYEPIVFLCGETINHVWAIYKNEIPQSELTNKKMHQLTHDFNHLIHFAKVNNLNYISGYNQKTDEWVALKDINPDLLLYCDPYDVYYLRDDWQPKNASKVYKAAYIHYCYLLVHTMEFYKQPIFSTAWKVFIETEEHTKIAEEELGLKVNNFVNLGYPKFDDYYFVETKFAKTLKKYDASKFEKLYIYAPHWTVSPKIDRGMGWYGNFINVYSEILELIKENQNFFWVFKPHPLLYPQLAHSYGKEKADETFNLFRELENVEFYEGHDYINLFKLSDGLLLDSNSFVAEYMPSKKPIVFLQKKVDLKLNPIGDELFASCYKVDVESNIIDGIHETLFRKDDYKYKDRMQMVDKYILTNKEKRPTDRIYEYIIKEL